MKQLFRTMAIQCVIALSAVIFTATVSAQALNIDEVLRAAQNGATQDRNAERARENRFRAELNKEQGRLRSMTNERVRQERISRELEAAFDVNTVEIKKLQEELARELGDLKQLFGVIQLSASEAQEDYKTSIISAQYPERAENLRQMVEKMASLTELVSIDEIEDLWVQLQTEMTQQGKVVTYDAAVNYVTGYEPLLDEEGNPVTDEKGKPTGEQKAIYEVRQMPVTRVGVFNAVTGNDILTYKDGKGLIALERQMGGDFSQASNNLQNLSSGATSFMIDPARGGLLQALVLKPSIDEKAEEGGIVGYVIMALGVVALLIALMRYLVLIGVESSVKKQARDMKRPSLKNPLGRVLKVYQDNPQSDPESLELKLGEAMLKESPKINRWIMVIKIIAVVAPLLGLLGTVTGMIQTFQAITLYGAGDPQTMAGGISQALVTTVLGLVVAIPSVFAHWLVSNKARNIEGVLEEQAAGLIAQKYEGLAK